MRWAAAALACVASFPTAADGADHTNLEEGLPLSVTDARPLGYLGREIQTFLRYDHTDRDEESFLAETRLEFGFPRNAQLSISVPYLFGEIEPDGFQAVRGEMLYNLNQEDVRLPSFSIAAALDFPVGNDAHGFDPVLKAIATKSIPFTEHFQQAHLNFEWLFNDDVRSGERTRSWRAVAGYSVRLGPDTLGLFDVVREVTLERGRRENLVELGIRHQLTPRAVFSAGVGAGFGDESPDVRGTLGFQFAF
jgi:hypothetical protein